MQEVLFSNDLFLIICELATEKVYELTQLELLSAFHLKLIRKALWSHFCVRISKRKYYNAPLISTHNFKNFYVAFKFKGTESKILNANQLYCSSTKIKNKVVKKLGHIPIMDLDYTFVDDRALKYLTSVRELSISGTKIIGNVLSKKFKVEKLDLAICYKFKGEKLGKLANLTELSLWGCSGITEKGFYELREISSLTRLNVGHTAVKGYHISELTFLQRLTISQCENIKDLYLTALTNLVCLDARESTQIDGSCLASLRRLSYLNLSKTRVTDDALRYASDVNTICLSGCDINDGLRYLTNVYNLDLVSCRNITDDSLAYLSNISNLNLSCTKIGDARLDFLSNARYLRLNGCSKVTNEGIKKLTNVGHLELYNTKVTEECIQYLSGTKTLWISFGTETIRILYPNITINGGLPPNKSILDDMTIEIKSIESLSSSECNDESYTVYTCESGSGGDTHSS